MFSELQVYGGKSARDESAVVTVTRSDLNGKLILWRTSSLIAVTLAPVSTKKLTG